MLGTFPNVLFEELKENSIPATAGNAGVGPEPSSLGVEPVLAALRTKRSSRRSDATAEDSEAWLELDPDVMSWNSAQSGGQTRRPHDLRVLRSRLAERWARALVTGRARGEGLGPGAA